MADVFISYSREDKPFIEKIVAAFEALGVSAWFDVRLRSGDSFDEVIAAEIEQSKAVLVCWSATSVASKWVKTEASFGEDQDMLAACFIEPCAPPFQFRLVNAVDLCQWSGETNHDGWLKILERVGPLIGRPGLLSLAQAMAPAAPANARAEWARQYPDDPMARTAWTSWLEREQARFGKEMDAARKSLDDFFNRRRASAKAKLTSVEKEFERWRAQANPGGALSAPDPKSVAAGLMAKGAEEGRSAEPLAGAVARANEAELEASRLRDENSSLALRLEEAETASHKAQAAAKEAADGAAELRRQLDEAKGRIVEPPGQTGPGWLALASAILVAFGVGAAGAYFALQPGPLGTEAKAIGAELDKSRAEAAQLKKDLGKTQEERAAASERLSKASQELAAATANAQQATERATAAQRALEQSSAAADNLRAELKKSHDELATVRSEKEDLEAAAKQQQLLAQQQPQQPQKTQQQQQGPNDNTVKVQANARSVKVCTQLAGGMYDTDNTTGEGQKSIDPGNQAIILSAISACKTAAETTDKKVKRQMLAQLGRSYAAYAVNLKIQGDDAEAARKNMNAAIGYLEQARGLGSAYATSLLAAYRDGKLGEEAGKGFFIPRRQADLAAPLYLEAAQLGNPTAMTNYAAAVLDHESGLTFDEQAVVNWLKRAESARYPQAFLIHAGAMLDERMSRGLSVEERRRAAANLADQAGCIDKDAAEKFYQRNRRLAPYRSTAPKC